MVYLGFTFNTINLVIVYLHSVCNTVNLVVVETIERNCKNYWVGDNTRLRINSFTVSHVLEIISAYNLFDTPRNFITSIM